MRRMILPLAVVTGLVLLWVLFFPDDLSTIDGPDLERSVASDKAPTKSMPSVTLPTATLTAKEVKKLFSGRSVESQTVIKQRRSLTYYLPDGEVRQLRNDNKRFGRWRVSKKGRMCLRMETLREKCRIIVREPGGGYRKYIVRKNGDHQPTVDYLQFWDGNESGL